MVSSKRYIYTYKIATMTAIDNLINSFITNQSVTAPSGILIFSPASLASVESYVKHYYHDKTKFVVDSFNFVQILIEFTDPNLTKKGFTYSEHLSNLVRHCHKYYRRDDFIPHLKPKTIMKFIDFNWQPDLIEKLPPEIFSVMTDQQFSTISNIDCLSPTQIDATLDNECITDTNIINQLKTKLPQIKPLQTKLPQRIPKLNSTGLHIGSDLVDIEHMVAFMDKKQLDDIHRQNLLPYIINNELSLELIIGTQKKFPNITFYCDLYDFIYAMTKFIIENEQYTDNMDVPNGIKKFIFDVLNYISTTVYNLTDPKLLDVSHNLAYIYCQLSYQCVKTKKNIHELDNLYRKLIDAIQKNIQLCNGTKGAFKRQANKCIIALNAKMKILESHKNIFEQNIKLIDEQISDAEKLVTDINIKNIFKNRV